MSFATKAGIIIGAAAFSGMAVAGTGEASNDLQSRLEAAEARIAELSAQQNSDWLTEQRAEQVRGVVQDVLADADTRASLQGTGATSGYNNGFFVQSADGKWSVKINGVFQERFVYAKNGDGGMGAGGSANLGNHDNAWGFETTRAALNFSGMLAGEAFYNARLNWSPYNGGNQLEWAYGGWKVDDTWSVSLGRQKFDVMRGYMVNAEDQQAIERSLQTNYWATSSVTNGIKLSGNMDQSRYNVMFSNGSGGNANNGYVNNDHDWAISGRGEWLMEGTWGQFDNMSSPAGSTDGWLLGVGAAYNKTNVGGTAPNAESKNWLVSGDLTYHSDGWNAYGSMTYGKNDPSGADDETNSFGWEVGAGMYMDADNELYARFSWLDPGQGAGANSSKLSILTIGWNHYIAGPNTKLSVDWNYGFSDQSYALANNTGATGYTDWWRNTGNSRNDGSNWMIRTQLQVAF